MAWAEKVTGPGLNLTGRPIWQKGQRPAFIAALRNVSRDISSAVTIPGLCRCDAAVSIGAHLNLFGLTGVTQKPGELLIIEACDCCYVVMDNCVRGSKALIGSEANAPIAPETQSFVRRFGSAERTGPVQSIQVEPALSIGRDRHPGNHWGLDRATTDVTFHLRHGCILF